MNTEDLTDGQLKDISAGIKLTPEIYTQQDFVELIHRLNKRNLDKVIEAYTMGYGHGRDDEILANLKDNV